MKRVIRIVIVLAFIVWTGIISYDYYLVKNEKNPKFCINSGINEYPDGAVRWCIGLGYKVFNYKRETYNALEFGPFWSQEKHYKN